MSEHPKHHIRTVDDFLKIPQEKLMHCLQDFQNWLTFATSEEMQLMLRAIPEMKPSFSEFIWVDDGKHEIIPTILVGEEGVGEP
jgi:hypothetical protein